MTMDTIVGESLVVHFDVTMFSKPSRALEIAHSSALNSIQEMRPEIDHQNFDRSHKKLVM